MPVQNIPGCQDIPDVEVAEVSYFIQMAPCTDDTGLRQAVLIDLRQVKSLPKLQPFRGLKTIKPKLKSVHAKQIISRKQISDFQKKIPTIAAKYWIETGRAIGRSYWAVGTTFSQTWLRKSLGRGRLLGSAPLGLYPSTRETNIKRWETLKSSSNSTDVFESARTSEISNSERFTTAIKKQMLHETNSTFNPSASINKISIPALEGIPVSIDGQLGIDSTSSTMKQDTIIRSSDFVQDATFKASESLKSSRTTVLAASFEGGVDETARETLSNPNRTNTLTYLYYEMVETYEVSIAVDSVDLFLHIPLPVDATISLPWLLANECQLRPLVPCEKLRSGFDAAARLQALDILSETRRKARAGRAAAGSNANAAAAADLKKVVKKVDDALEAYKTLSGAKPGPSHGGSWIYWEIVKVVSEPIADAFEKLQLRWNAETFQENDPASVGEAIDGFARDIGDIDFEFGKVDAAIAIFLGGVALASPVIAGPVVLAVIALAATAEALGVDLYPDSRGVPRLAESFINARQSLIADSVVPVAAGAPANADVDAARAAERQRQEDELAERADLITLTDALRLHIRERRHFYHQALWSSHDHNWIADRIREIGLPPALFELRFQSFEGEYGAVALRNLDLAKSYGFKTSSLQKLRQTATAVDLSSHKRSMVIPAPGMLVEPYLGRCSGADEFVSGHRALDLEIAVAKRNEAVALARFAEKEAERLDARIAAGNLDDPRPVPAEIRVALANPAPVTQPSGPTGPTPSPGN